MAGGKLGGTKVCGAVVSEVHPRPSLQMLLPGQGFFSSFLSYIYIKNVFLMDTQSVFLLKVVSPIGKA